MRAFTYASSLPVTWQRWRSHDSIRRSSKPHATRRLRCSLCYLTEDIADRSFTLHCGNKNFGFFFAFVTLPSTGWPSYTNWTREVGKLGLWNTHQISPWKYLRLPYFWFKYYNSTTLLLSMNRTPSSSSSLTPSSTSTTMMTMKKTTKANVLN